MKSIFFNFNPNITVKFHTILKIYLTKRKTQSYMIIPSYCLSRILCDDLLNYINEFMTNPYEIYREHAEINYNLFRTLLDHEFNQMFLTWQFTNCFCQYAISELSKYKPSKFRIDSFICSITRNCPEYSILSRRKDVLMSIGCITPEKWRLLGILDKQYFYNNTY